METTSPKEPHSTIISKAMESVDSPRPKSVPGETPRAAGLPTLTNARGRGRRGQPPTQFVPNERSHSEGCRTPTTAWISRAP